MRVATTFEVSVPRDRVAAYLADPRHLVVANHKRPVLEQSDGPMAAGSWFVLGLDQLRARIQYTTYEPPHRLAVSLVMGGRGSGGMKSQQEFVLSDLQDGAGTRVEAVAEGEGGLVRWGPLMRLSQTLTWRRLRRKIEADA